MKSIVLCVCSLFFELGIRADVEFSTVISPGNTTVGDRSGEYGATFSNMSGTEVVITKLGRWVVPGNSQEHTITLYAKTGNNEKLGETTIDCSSAMAGAFVWGRLEAPVVVPVGGVVYVLSSENSGGDRMYWPFGNPQLANDTEIYGQNDVGALSSAVRENGVFRDTGGWGRSYGPVSFQYNSPVPTWTKSGGTYVTDGSLYQVRSAIMDADDGDVVTVPQGDFYWESALAVTKPIVLEGAGMGKTRVYMGTETTPSFTSTFLSLSSGVTVRGFSFYDSLEKRNSLFSTGGARDWRVTEVEYVQRGGQGGYFAFIQHSVRGLIDNCVITGDSGTAELIFARGPLDAWDVSSTLGGADNIFVENCVFNGQGYVCDANAAARMVVRFNTVDGSMKVDGHGVWSNSGPQRGVRHMEVYNNKWTSNARNTAIEIRGGTGFIFDNVSEADGSTNMPWFFLTEYGVRVSNGAFDRYQNPQDYPIRDQIGRGRYRLSGDWRTASSEPMYLWNNSKAGIDWGFDYQRIPSQSLDLYREISGDSVADFGWDDIIQADRDYFKHAVGSNFDGSSGVGIGSFAEMNAIQSAVEGCGFWVTDQGEWNETNSETPDGKLYRWDGSNWVFHYMPYVYPHPGYGPRAPDDPDGLNIVRPEKPEA